MIVIGNIRTADIKKASFELLNKYPDKFKADFEQNKTALKELNIVEHKKVRNRIAGYIATIAKRRAKKAIS